MFYMLFILFLQESAETKKTYTYSQLEKNTSAFATSLLKKFGLKPGDVVAVMLPNCPEFPVVAFGCFQAGCVLTTVNPIYKECEFIFVCYFILEGSPNQSRHFDYAQSVLLFINLNSKRKQQYLNKNTSSK